MEIKAEVFINGPKEKVWKIITDFENAAKNIEGIEKVEVLEKPDQGIIGLKWQETRMMFGKAATEVMWITDAVENEYYTTHAESHGSIYTSKHSITDQADGTLLKMEFSAKAQSFSTKLLSATIGVLFKGTTKKLLQQDLENIKQVVEKQSK